MIWNIITIRYYDTCPNITRIRINTVFLKPNIIQYIAVTCTVGKLVRVETQTLRCSILSIHYVFTGHLMIVGDSLRIVWVSTHM